LTGMLAGTSSLLAYTAVVVKMGYVIS